MLEVDVHTHRDRLAALHPEWTEALAATEVERDAPATLDWYRDAIDRSMTDVEPLVVVASARDRLLGIVPFVVERRPTWLGVIRVVRFASSPLGSRCGAVGPHPGTALVAALRRLTGDPNWDVLRLEDPTLRTRTRTALRTARLAFRQREIEITLNDERTASGLRLFLEDEETATCDRYVAWRRRSPRTWLAARDPGFHRWLHYGSLVVDLATDEPVEDRTIESPAVAPHAADAVGGRIR